MKGGARLPPWAASALAGATQRQRFAAAQAFAATRQGTVEISLSPTKIRFGLGSAILTSKLIDGTFPDYNRVIPTANDKLLKLDPKSFSAGVDRVSSVQAADESEI